MANILVFSVSKREGIGKQSMKPYQMLEVGGLLESDDGSKQPAKIAIFGSPDNPLPLVEENKRYEIIVDFFIDRFMNAQPRVIGLAVCK